MSYNLILAFPLIMFVILFGGCFMRMYISDKESMLRYLKGMLFPYFLNRKQYKKEVANYSETSADFEQFSRFLFGITAYLYNCNDKELFNDVLSELKSYINPSSSAYIDIEKGTDSQIFVEMFSPLFFLYTFRNEAEGFIKENSEIIDNWFSKIFDLDIPDQDNWIWFQIMTNCFLYKIGIREFDYEYNKSKQRKIDLLYKKEGYYIDGPYGEFDNYNAYAFFFYSLIYATLMKNEDYQNSKKHVERASKFLYIYINCFSNNGRNIPYGRSLTYKYGVLAFASAIVYSKIEPLYYGYLKDLIFKTLNEWLDQKIYRDGKYLINGYYYENNNMMEDYNSYGSPYWAFKAFVLLAADNNLFWNSIPKDFSELKEDIHLTNGIIKQYDGEQYFFPVVTPIGYRCTLHPDKYEKGVYSTLFGFNVSKGTDSSNLAKDNTFSLSYDDRRFLNRSFVESNAISKNIVKSKYNFPFTNIIQYDFIQMPFIFRLYLIDSKHKCSVAVGAYPVNEVDTSIDLKDGWCIIKNGYQCSGIKAMDSLGIECFERQCPNTNIYYRKSIVPICNYKIQKGKTYLAILLFGCKNEPNEIVNPKITQSGNHIKIVFGEIDYDINLNEKYKNGSAILQRKIKIIRKLHGYKRKIKKILGLIAR